MRLISRVKALVAQQPRNGMAIFFLLGIVVGIGGAAAWKPLASLAMRRPAAGAAPTMAELARKLSAAGDYGDAAVLLAEEMRTAPSDATLRALAAEVSAGLDGELNAQALSDARGKEQFDSLAAMLGRNQAALDILSRRLTAIERSTEVGASLDGVIAAGSSAVLPQLYDGRKTDADAEAAKLLAAGKAAQAYDLYAAAVERNANDERALLGAAKALAALPGAGAKDRQDRIIGLLERATKLRPDDSEARHCLAASYEARKDWGKAREALVHGLGLQAADGPDWTRAGDLAMESGDAKAADACYANAVSCNPRDPSALLSRAELALASGRAADAANLARKALESDPTNERAGSALASALDSAGPTAEAAKCWEDLFSRNARPAYALRAAQDYLGAGSAESSIRMARASIEANPAASLADRKTAAQAYLFWVRAQEKQGASAKDILATARKGLAADGTSAALATLFADHAVDAASAAEARRYLETAIRAGADGAPRAALDRLGRRYPEEGIPR